MIDRHDSSRSIVTCQFTRGGAERVIDPDVFEMTSRGIFEVDGLFLMEIRSVYERLAGLASVKPSKKWLLLLLRMRITCYIYYIFPI